MENRIQDLPFEAAALHGLSEQSIRSHHQNNYGGAVKRLNAIRSKLAARSPATLPGFELNGLKREELVANNSMLPHELYFGSLGGDGQTMTAAMELALQVRAAGLRARYLRGGIDGWQAAGRDLEPRGEAS